MNEQPYTIVYIRVNGGPNAGMGHLYRCRNLALALRERLEVTFLIDEAPTSFLSVLDQDGIAWRKRTGRDDLIAKQICLFDGYDFGATDFARARQYKNLVIAIDDLASDYFDCDLVVSPGSQNRREDYRAADNCLFLLGTEFALINPCFYTQNYKFRPEIQRLFVGFGGTDPRDMTRFAVEALSSTDFALEVLVGAGYSHNTARLTGPRISLHRAMTQEAAAVLMARCDAAIASGGTMSLELAAVGVPVLLFAFAENQVRPAAALAAHNLAAYGGVIPDQGAASFRDAGIAFARAQKKRREIYENIRRVFRESGATRVAAEIQKLAFARRGPSSSHVASPTIRLVPFAASHFDRTRHWINDPRVAEPFLFSRTITEDAHTRWFSALEADRSQVLYAIVNESGEHVGNIGFKNIDRVIRNGELWTYLTPEAHGRGVGSAAVACAAAAAFDQLRLERIYLHVSPTNGAAYRIYQKSGFHVTERAARSLSFAGTTVALDRMELSASEGDSSRRRGPRVALMQPMFLPWLGYFELLDAVDIFIVLDDYQFSRQGWGHRNRLFLSPGRPGILSLPIRHPGDLKATFLDVAPATDSRWCDKLERTLTQTYGRGAGFAAIWPEIRDALFATTTNVAELEIHLIKIIGRWLGVRGNLRRSSEFPATAGLGRSQRLVALLDAVQAGSYYAARGSVAYMRADGVFPLERLPVFFQDFEPVAYSQPGSATFVPRLSALDALFNVPASEACAVMHGTRRWLMWDEAATQAAEMPEYEA